MPDTYRDGVARRPVTELRPGDHVDLELDIFADPCGLLAAEDPDEPGAGSEHPEFEFEYEVVEHTERETPGCIRVDFESGFSCGFPPEHEVEVDSEQVRDDGEVQ